MTKTILALSLLFCLPLFAQSPDAGYNLNIHVSESRIGTDCGVSSGNSSCKSVQQLAALIDGAKYELEGETYFPKGIVALGDYKAKLVKDQQKPTHEFNRTYELMFPDGSTRKFRVTGQVE
jgi:hypothetical protein